MKPEEIAISVILIALLAAVVVFLTVKGQRQQISIMNSGGKSVTLQVEMADNPITRSKGLMGRSSLGADGGMLFVFERPGRYGFWMMNTSIPLDAIFFAQNGTVVDIIQMAPCGLIGCQTYTPQQDAVYVLEVSQGFSADNNISIGKSMLKMES